MKIEEVMTQTFWVSLSLMNGVRNFNQMMTLLAPKKNIFLHVIFKDDQIMNFIYHKTRAVSERVYPTEQLCLLSTTRDIVFYVGKDQLSEASASNVICQFICSCGNIFIDSTNRQVSKPMSQHISQRLMKSIVSQNNEVKTRNQPQ